MIDIWPDIAPVAGTPPCGPPTFEPGSGWCVTRHADVRAALTDPAFGVPAVDIGPPGTLAWLRASVSRFSPPERHAGRRAIGVRALAELDPDELRHAAARLTIALVDRAGDHLDVMRDLGRPVPLRVLAGRLGLVDPAAAGTAVAVVAAAYHPGLIRRWPRGPTGRWRRCWRSARRPRRRYGRTSSVCWSRRATRPPA
ncbi:hypothetical protein [Micromonospora sp. CA-246542]|uniref:hypothetical protein n=1 Tax=Micromonospora sp. CA-246542 TaxID=3239959 RepID=UPI003D9153D6